MLSRGSALGGFREQFGGESSDPFIDLSNRVVDHANGAVLHAPHFLGGPLQQIALFQGLERKIGDCLVDLLDRWTRVISVFLPVVMIRPP